MLELNLLRDPSGPVATIGQITIAGAHACYTCEDVVRPIGQKIAGETAIPEGRYRIIVNRSERFSRLAGREILLPLLLDVPWFSGVRIHPGNTAAQTEGCILPGLSRTTSTVGQSRVAFDALFARIQAALAAGEEVWIKISQKAS